MADPTDAAGRAAPRRRLAVLGSPIAHSLSPALHAAAYRVLGLNWEYTAVQIGEGELDGFLDALTPEWLGLSLTMPLKHEVQPRLDDLDRVATLTGAVNTVRFGHAAAGEGDGTGAARRPFSGYNTDVPGLVRALAEAGMDRAAHVTLLGAGATAASALAAAAELGAETVDIIARTPSRADPLLDLGRKLGLVVTVSGLPTMAATDRVTDLVISTMPGDAALEHEFPATLRATTLLFDVGYAPWPTALAHSWAVAGGSALSGRTMLLHQAVVQIRIFLANDPFLPLPGEDAVLEAMRAVLPAATAPVDAAGGTAPGRAVEG
ncbi:shikimate dehydrogenase [Cryobacterium adonitolivorans]|uniref:Shikimate dehydrogenase n=1 Tax=Cryobacterium adonitolivorans TaxID=1259189 RepID=A0A4R8WBN3_9MICO|nr:shikimate dehydrogenase [Cryobacterium adonitolivorans]TFC04326.1 shikimate dehydrogenase [Cryobacterium adonitolivorans]